MERMEDVDEALLSFLSDRMPVPMTKKFMSKNDKKEARGKTLNYEKESAEIRNGLDASRKFEWQKWLKFAAGRPCFGKELKRLLDE